MPDTITALREVAQASNAMRDRLLQTKSPALAKPFADARAKFKGACTEDAVLALLDVVQAAQKHSDALRRICGAAWDGEASVISLRAALSSMSTATDTGRNDG